MLNILETILLLIIIIVIPLIVSLLFRKVKGWWVLLSYLPSGFIALQYGNAEYMLDNYFFNMKWDTAEGVGAAFFTLYIVVPVAILSQFIFNFLLRKRMKRKEAQI